MFIYGFRLKKKKKKKKKKKIGHVSEIPSCANWAGRTFCEDFFPFELLSSSRFAFVYFFALRVPTFLPRFLSLFAIYLLFLCFSFVSFHVFVRVNVTVFAVPFVLECHSPAALVVIPRPRGTII